MMEEFSDNDLEKQLRDAAKELQLKPSGKVWAAIGDELHPRRKIYPFWWAAAGVLLIVGLGLCVLLRNEAGPSGTLHKEAQTQASAGNLPRDIPSSASGGNADDSPGGTKSSSLTKTGQAPQAAGVSGNASGSAGSTAPHSPAGGRASFLSGKDEMDRQAFAPLQGNRKATLLPSLKNLPATFSFPVSGEVPKTAHLLAAPLKKEVVTLIPGHHSLSDKKPVAALNIHPRKKPAFDIFFTPGIGYRTLKTTAPAAPPPATASGVMSLSYRARAVQPPAVVKIRQRPAWSWSAGVGAMFPLERHWFLRSGVSLAKTGYNILAYGTYPAYIEDGTTSYADPVVGAGMNSSLTANPIVADTRKPSYVHSSYLAAEIPLMIGRQFGDAATVSYSLGAGADLSYLVGSHAVIYSPESKRYFTDKEDVRPFNGGLDLQATINIPLSGQWRISVGPSFRYQLFSTYRHYPLVKEHPYLLGIKTALQLIR